MTKAERLANVAEQIITIVENNTQAPKMCAERVALYRKIQNEETVTEQASEPDGSYLCSGCHQAVWENVPCLRCDIGQPIMSHLADGLAWIGY